MRVAQWLRRPCAAHEPHDLSIGLWTLAGLTAFLIVEKLVRLAKGEAGHGHSHGPPPKKAKAAKKSKTSDADDTADEDVAVVHAPKADMAVAGYLNLAADFEHNFNDVLAVGASFLAGRVAPPHHSLQATRWAC